MESQSQSTAGTLRKRPSMKNQRSSFTMAILNSPAGPENPTRSRALPLIEDKSDEEDDFSVDDSTDRKAEDANERVTMPEEYRANPTRARPIPNKLQNLNTEKSSLQEMLSAAEADFRLHLARIQAVLKKDPNLVETWNWETDPTVLERRNRSKVRLENMEMLRSVSQKIMESFQAPRSGNLTQAEIQRDRIQKWQRALDLYVYGVHDEMDLWKLLDKLCEGCHEEEELLEALSQAASISNGLVESTSLAVKDALQDAVDAEARYQLRMEAHSIYSQRVLKDAQRAERKFRQCGKTAMKIGQQLEFAEAKLCQCEKASVILRVWWAMEHLAQQEQSSGEVIPVQEEVRGQVPEEECKLDRLFTLPENSLFAAKALQALRHVVKSRGATTSSGMMDPNSIRRFDITSKLIARTSEAVESRLLNAFTAVYSMGGVYDFEEEAMSGKDGHIDFVQLRDIASALMHFEHGRTLFARYVHVVVTKRFPELFDDENWYSDDSDEENEEKEVDMDATRSKLSNLFMRVTEVCTEEFELIAHVFNTTDTDVPLMHDEPVSLIVARLLLQRIIRHPRTGLEARTNDLLSSIDRRGDIDSGSKKLDTIVVIHEKAAGLFILLKEAAENKLFSSEANNAKKPEDADPITPTPNATSNPNERALSSITHFLTMEENALSDGHRRGYLNLELRLLHHECCALFESVGAKMLPLPKRDRSSPYNSDRNQKDIVLAEYRAPTLPLDTTALVKAGYTPLLNGVLKTNVLRRPLILASDSLARARLMFGGGVEPDSTARVVLAIYTQMCQFYGAAYLFPVLAALAQMLEVSPPSNPPNLPFNEDSPPHDLGVEGRYWVALERVQSAAKHFDRELWAEQRVGSARVWELIVNTGSHTSLSLARERRQRFFREVETRGEDTCMRALESICKHVYWILVTGGEAASNLADRGNWLFQQTQNKDGRAQGPYAVPAGSSLEANISPAVKSLTYCLRAQFVNVQAALTPQALSAFWTALSLRLHDILCGRLLAYYLVSTVGAVILSRDVEALVSVATLAGADHSHWDILRELLTLYMTPPDALKAILVGPEGGKGLFARAGQDRSLVFMSRRFDFRIKTNAGLKKSAWAVELLSELGVKDPSEGAVDISSYAAGSRRQ